MKCAQILLLLLICTVAHGGEVLVPMTVDTDVSSLELTLKVGDDSSTTTQTLKGSMLIAVDGAAPLNGASLRDFQFRTVTDYQFVLLMGLFKAGTTNLEIIHAAPGSAQPYVPVLPDGTLLFTNVPHRLQGTAVYETADFVCTLLQLGGLPCHDVIDLAGRQTTPIEEFPGVVTLSNGRLSFSGHFKFGPLTVAPGSTIYGGATVCASGSLRPCLVIQHGDSTNNHRLSWGSAFSDFRLQLTSSLDPPVQWNGADGLLSDEGTTISVLLQAEERRGFYRLTNE